MLELEQRQQRLEYLISNLAKVATGLSELITDKNVVIAELETGEMAEDERDSKYMEELNTLIDSLKGLIPEPSTTTPDTITATAEEITTPI